MPENQLILIADDFGLSPGINRAILELLAEGLISGTSAMVNMPYFAAGADSLSTFRDKAELGLHLTLTLGRPTSAMPKLAPTGPFPSLKEIMRKSVTGKLDHTELSNEIFRQITLFRAQMGFLPHYIDGHQHVHILPFIRAALFDALARIPNYRPWIRNPFDRLGAIIARGVEVRKSLTLAALSLGFGTQCARRGYRTNDSFSGASDFDPLSDYTAMFASYLKVPARAHLVMCHPGYIGRDEILPDPVRDTRSIELQFLKSAEFKLLLTMAGISVSRFPTPDHEQE
jgi:predicted glycoside hydrolase/deacetylase ChbG (UPF0249 family)